MTRVFILVGALVGLSVGSFFNVVIYRTPRRLSVVRPASFCPSCQTEISSRDNIPVLAWLLLRGKCRTCGEPISIRYPLVEAGTAAVFVALAATIRPLWGIPGWWALASAIGVAAVIEADGQACPLAVTGTGAAIGIVALGVGAAAAGHLGPTPWAALGLGAGAVAGGALATSPDVRERIGYGALGTIPVFGACLGWLGLVPAVVGVAVVIGGVPATTWIVSRLPRPWARLPLAICCSAGLIAAVVTAGLRS
jgi:leader peptidase (prepilin peptidase)/N-methyltransferase